MRVMDKVVLEARLRRLGSSAARLIGVDEGHVLVARPKALEAALVQPRLRVDGHCGGRTEETDQARTEHGP